MTELPGQPRQDPAGDHRSAIRQLPGRRRHRTSGGRLRSNRRERHPRTGSRSLVEGRRLPHRCQSPPGLVPGGFSLCAGNGVGGAAMGIASLNPSYGVVLQATSRSA
nr:hypothetical protein [Pseudomonas citronellolis]